MNVSIMPKLKHSLSSDAKQRLLLLPFIAMDNEVMTIQERIKEAIDSMGRGGKTKISKECDVTAQAITGWIKYGRVDKSNLAVLAKLSGYNFLWLATGEGSKRIHDTSGSLVGSDAVIKPLIDAEEHGFLPIQHAALIVKAGIDGFTVDHIDDMKPPIFFREDWYRDNGYKPEKMLAVSVSGESMWPKMSPGDVVIINTASNQPIDGKVFVVNYEGEVVIKRLARDAGQWWLSSDNPDKQRYPNKLCAGDYCLVIGEVVYLQTRSI